MDFRETLFFPVGKLAPREGGIGLVNTSEFDASLAAIRNGTVCVNLFTIGYGDAAPEPPTRGNTDLPQTRRLSPNADYLIPQVYLIRTACI